MSIKIYNAYVCDQNYSMYNLMQKLLSAKQEIRRLAQESRTRYVAKLYTHYLDYLAIFGADAVKEQLQRAEENLGNSKGLSVHTMKNIWKVLSAESVDKESLRFYVDAYFAEKAYEDSNSKLRMDSEFDFNSSVVIVPMEDKQLLMYFGSDDGRDVIKHLPWLSDYHYQNQTDAPKGISDEEWELRRQTWEKAIGPDYRPINHGMEIKLFDSAYDFIHLSYEAEKLHDYEPAIEERAKWLIDYMNDYPNPPKGSYSVEWVKYLRSAEYIDWKKARLKELMQKLKEIPVDWK